MSKKPITFESVMVNNVLSKTKAKEYKALSSKKERDKRALFIVEGEKSVLDTLDSFELKHLICKSGWLNSNKEIENKYREKILISDERGMEIISSHSSIPEVIAIFHQLKTESGIPKLYSDKLYLLLEGIQDPGNLGTIIRTCDWFGVYEIFASPNTVDVYSPKVIQSSMGSLARVKVRYLDLEELINSNKDIPVLGTFLDGEPIDTLKKDTKGLLVMGNEGNGISENLKQYIHQKVTIPPINKHNHPDSLNVAIATAIILSHLK